LERFRPANSPALLRAAQEREKGLKEFRKKVPAASFGWRVKSSWTLGRAAKGTQWWGSRATKRLNGSTHGKRKNGSSLTPNGFPACNGRYAAQNKAMGSLGLMLERGKQPVDLD